MWCGGVVGWGLGRSEETDLTQGARPTRHARTHRHAQNGRENSAGATKPSRPPTSYSVKYTAHTHPPTRTHQLQHPARCALPPPPTTNITPPHTQTHAPAPARCAPLHRPRTSAAAPPRWGGRTACPGSAGKKGKQSGRLQGVMAMWGGVRWGGSAGAAVCKTWRLLGCPQAPDQEAGCLCCRAGQHAPGLHTSQQEGPWRTGKGREGGFTLKKAEARAAACIHVSRLGKTARIHKLM